MLRKLVQKLRHGSEVLAAGLLAVIFVSFIIQIALRYVFNWPVGWTAELSVIPPRRIYRRLYLDD